MSNWSLAEQIDGGTALFVTAYLAGVGLRTINIEAPKTLMDGPLPMGGQT